MSEPVVYTVIVNWNGKRYLKECLTSLRNQTYHNIKVVIVDNGSTDGSEKFVKEYFPEVITIQTGDNLGVAAGNNLGIQYALSERADYVLLLNNDVRLNEDLVHKLVNAILRIGKECAAVCPKIYFYDYPEIIWSTGGHVVLWRGAGYDIGSGSKDNGQFDRERSVSCSNTCCLMIKAGVFDSVGLMDERYFMYFDDIDVTMRLTRNGYKIFYIPGARLWHKVQGSSLADGEMPKQQTLVGLYYTTRNRLLFARKHTRNKIEYGLFHVFFYGVHLMRASACIVRGDFIRVKIMVRAVGDYYLGKFGRRV